VNVVQVKVTDDGTPALSVTNSLTLTVSEVNVAPVLAVPANQAIQANSLLSVHPQVVDGDLPAQALTFALISAPAGMSIDPTSGLITWTPAELQSPSTNVVQVSVTDTCPDAVNATSLSDTQSFTVVVEATAARAPLLGPPVITSTSVTLSWTAIPGRTYRIQSVPDLDGTVWTDLGEVTTEGSVGAWTESRTGGHRFYRVQSSP
jgi:hypothetical protein